MPQFHSHSPGSRTNGIAQGTAQAAALRHVNALTIDVEDYFQVSAFAPHIARSEWNTRECHIERNVERILDMLALRGIHATFFTLGWMAERYPAMVRSIAHAGHELASHGYASGNQELIRKDGFSLLDIKNYLARHDFVADAFEFPLAKLVEARLPALVLLIFSKNMTTVKRRMRCIFRLVPGEYGHGAKAIERGSKEAITCRANAAKRQGLCRSGSGRWRGTPDGVHVEGAV